jgi:glycosyltransferase involved in cell wall biosynthesis
MKDASGAQGMPALSLVIPVYNEEESIAPLYEELCAVLENVGKNSEVIFVDDGSTDATLEKLKAIPGIAIVSLSRNSGKSKALEAGFAVSRGEIVVTLDGDLQDDPKELSKFLEAIEKGSDLVCGWKKMRHDPFEKRFFSKIANAGARILAGSVVHDMNCGFKAFRGNIARELRLFGDMHRYIPAVVSNMGYRVTEVVVNHRERKYGKSKYGLSRLIAGFFDLITLLFMRRFFDRPMHFFGLWGLVLSGTGTLMLLYLSYLRLFLNATIGNRPLLFLSILLVVVGFQSLSLGLIGELIIRQGGSKSQVPIRFLQNAGERRS